MCQYIAIELTVEHANEPSSFQANSVDVSRPEEKVTPRYLSCLTMRKMVSLTNRGEEGRVGVDVKEQKVLVDQSTDGVYILLHKYVASPLESKLSDIGLSHGHKL